MILDRIYHNWNERSLRQMTPQREQIMLETWARFSKHGYLRFALTFLAASLFLSLCSALIYLHTMHPYPPQVDPHVMARMDTWFLLTMTSIFVITGFVFSLMFYFSFKMWAMKIENWRSSGRL